MKENMIEFYDWLIKIVSDTGMILFAPFKELMIFKASMTVLFIMIVIDTICGIYYALKLKRFNSRGFLKSLKKIITYFAAIVAVRLLETGIEPLFETSILTHLMTSFLILIETISVLKNLTLLGVPLPGGFVNIIMKYIKNDTLEELLSKGNIKSEYIQEIMDIINYQLPNIKSEKMQIILRTRLEEWANAINIIDMQFSENTADNNDIIFYRAAALINTTNNLINKKLREKGISEEYVREYEERQCPRFQKYMDYVKEICYSNDSIEAKKRKIIEGTIVMLYETVMDIQKLNNNLKCIKSV